MEDIVVDIAKRTLLGMAGLYFFTSQTRLNLIVQQAMVSAVAVEIYMQVFHKGEAT